MNNGSGILTLTIAVPAVGALLLALVPETYKKAIKGLAILVSAAAFIVSLSVLSVFKGQSYHLQLVESVPWLPQLGITYKVGVDGISVWLFLLTTLLTFLSAVFSVYVDKRVKAYFVLMLLLEAAMLGVFVSLDLILFYTFFEFTLIPMAMLIWIWGGAQRNYAAVKFFLYTFLASIFMLLGIIAVANRYATVMPSHEFTFDLIKIQNAVATGQLWQGADGGWLQSVLFWAFSLALMVKCPMFPFHTWLPDAHTEAPTAGSIILAGVLLKMGTYGFLRIVMPIFPNATMANMYIMLTLAVIGIIYGAIVAAVQPDVKKLVAYSSVAHMGFVMYGIFSLTHTGMVGGAYQQLNHGISTGALFLLIGLLYERIHTREFKAMGGLKAQMPVYAALFLIVMLSSVGLPGLNGFVGEFLAMAGGFQRTFADGHHLLYIFAGIGVILAAVYLLWMFQKLFYGQITNPTLKGLKDLKPWEIGLVSVFIVFIFWGGVMPNTFMKSTEAALDATRQMVVNRENARPLWGDLTYEVNAEGDLLRVQERSDVGSYTEVKRVMTNDYYLSDDFKGPVVAMGGRR
ncbi:MAG: NADH-quinone oxidoreductase subunit M [Fimbriimonadaceae bacterium]|nr:NADH-quinone oxidoreductase subunit M [Fimbriimonadaceae bacterium]